MKPPVFSYQDPRTLPEGLDALAEHGDDARVLAGGQSLLPLLTMRLVRPRVVVDINKVDGLGRMSRDGGALRIGALVRAFAAERDAEVADALPVLAEAIGHIAHPQIRNRCTIGGNIAHADPSSELPAVLAALDGAVRLVSRGGERVVGWDEFFRSGFVTARGPDELLTEVIFPIRPGFAFRFREFARHRGGTAIAAVCVGLRVQEGIVSEARLAAIGVADRPVRLLEAEGALAGRRLDAGAAEQAGALASLEVDPPTDVHGGAVFRRGILAALVRRTIEGWDREEQAA
ncbi:xanthine dehydrogenase family protein subunit M [Microbispora sp. NEAU-D428]|uniref:FAD binding domain-containing protein n=1 Tax=Microbispora sitophila TaxID=2771537 RepID=UPI001866EE6D|nr:xanthine dehydrogenase family protein subunit M [Microbispora sitophila]MBE3014796.1 xanthine dehydrogenase family protein subunit M [Microbispora sitophila]